MVFKQNMRITLFCIITLLISAALSLTAAADQTTVKIFGIIIDNDINLKPGEKPELKEDFKVEIEGLSVATYTNSNGVFNLSDIPVSDKPYSMKISKEGYLQRTVQIIGLNSQTTSLNVLVNMWLGDIVQDNNICMSDIIELAKCFNSSKGDNDYRDNCDLNKDNVINILDVMAAAKHFNMEYPPVSFSPVTNVISVDLVKQSYIEVTFDNAVTVDNILNTNFYWNTNGVEGNNKNCADSKPVTVIDEKTLGVNFNTNNFGNDITYFFVSGMKDYYGNPIPTKRFLVSNIPDTPSELIDAQADGDAAIKLSFSKPLNPDSVNTANIKMKGSRGEDVTIRSAVLDNTKKIVTLYFEIQPGGNYTIALSNLCADTGIKIPTQNVIVPIIDTTPINEVSVFSVNSGKDDNNKFLPDYAIIKFPEAMLTTGSFSISDKSKYSIAVSGNSGSVIYSALNEKDTLTVIDDRTVKITFAEDKFLDGDFYTSTLYMKVVLVADKAGNINPVPIYNNETAIERNNCCDITNASVKMIDLRTITIYVDRLINAVSATDFLITDGISTIYPVAAVFENATDGSNSSTIKLTMNSDLNKEGVYNLRTVGSTDYVSGTRDIYDIYFKASVQKTVYNCISPRISKVSYTGTDKVVITFDKEMGIVVPGDFVVRNGVNTYYGKSAGKFGSSKVYVIEFSGLVDSSFKISTVSAPQTEDIFFNKLSAASDISISSLLDLN